MYIKAHKKVQDDLKLFLSIWRKAYQAVMLNDFLAFAVDYLTDCLTSDFLTSGCLTFSSETSNLDE